MERVSRLPRVDCREVSFLGASSTMRKPPPVVLISKTVSEDSLSSSDDRAVHNNKAHPAYKREERIPLESNLRTVESVLYHTSYYPSQPPPPPPPQPPQPHYMSMGGHQAYHHHHAPPMAIHDGHYHCTPYYASHAAPHHHHVPCGYVFVPFQEPPRSMPTNIPATSYNASSENRPPIHSQIYNQSQILNLYPPLVIPPRKTKTQKKESSLGKPLQVPAPGAPPPPIKQKTEESILIKDEAQVKPKEKSACAAILLLEAARFHEERAQTSKDQGIAIQSIDSLVLPKPGEKAGAKVPPHNTRSDEPKFRLAQLEHQETSKVVRAETKMVTCAATLLLEAARVQQEREDAIKEQHAETDRNCNKSTQAFEIQSIEAPKTTLTTDTKASPHRATSKEAKYRLLSRYEIQASKGKWSTQEDDILRDAVIKLGARRWAKIAELLPGRLGKHCRNRWCQHLSPNVRKGDWGLDEDYAILKGHAQHGNRWALIARDMLGRTDNAIKNRFHSSMKAKIELYLMYQRGTDCLEVDSYGRYDYQDDLEGCLWMVHGIPGGQKSTEYAYRGDCNSGVYCESVRVFAAKWKKEQQQQQLEKSTQRMSTRLPMKTDFNGKTGDNVSMNVLC